MPGVRTRKGDAAIRLDRRLQCDWPPRGEIDGWQKVERICFSARSSAQDRRRPGGHLPAILRPAC